MQLISSAQRVLLSSMSFFFDRPWFLSEEHANYSYDSLSISEFEAAFLMSVVIPMPFFSGLLLFRGNLSDQKLMAGIERR